MGRADQFEAVRVLDDLAGVEDGEDEGGSGGERLGRGKDGLLGVAGVVGVGSDGRLGKGDGLQTGGGCGGGRKPVQGGRKLQGNAGDRGVGAVAEGERNVSGFTGFCGDEVEVEIQGEDFNGVSLGIGDGGLGVDVGGMESCASDEAII